MGQGENTSLLTNFNLSSVFLFDSFHISKKYYLFYWQNTTNRINSGFNWQVGRSNRETL